MAANSPDAPTGVNDSPCKVELISKVKMALAFKARPISVAFGTVSFFMADDDRTIRVDVSRDLLARIDAPPHNSKHGYIERLMRHRSQFAQIAAAKYDDGQYEPEVKVLVVRIGLDDLLE